MKWLSVRWRYCPDLAVATSLNDLLIKRKRNLNVLPSQAVESKSIMKGTAFHVCIFPEDDTNKNGAGLPAQPIGFRRPTDRQAALRQDAEPPIALSVYEIVGI